MDRVNDLISIVQRGVADYHNVHTRQASSYYVEDQARQIYMVITVPDLPCPFPARVIVMARVVGNKVIIEEDTTDRPLVEALIRCGIPREHIILVYAGETLAEA